MIVKDCPDGKIILLSKQLDTRPKILNLIYSLVYLVLGTFLLRLSLFYTPETLATILFMLGATVLYIAAYRFGNKACLTEKLYIDKKQIKIIKQGLFTPNKQSFDIDKISNFRHIAKQQFPKHPLSGNSFDYLGFQTEQEVINDMLKINRIVFDYNDKTITCAENFHSWGFEALELLLYEITGNDLRYSDEYEKAFKSNALGE
ncbi:MAG: hypothetical protein INR73_26480 [Williamsia sp.]|nr:hypothetical protein [Williamsia sp.]